MSGFAKKKHQRKTKSLLFYIALLFFPIVQFLVFYVGVNVRSLVLAFTDPESGAFTLSFFQNLFGVEGKTILLATRMSFIVYAISLFVGVPLGVVFAYYIYKQYFGYRLFRVFLYIPSILSVTVMATLYYYFMAGTGSSWFFHGVNPFQETRYQFLVLALFNVLISFGNSVIMYTNRMTAVNPEIIEAAKIDGAGALREFWNIVLPEAYGTIEVFLVTGIATIFTNQWCLYLFYTTGGGLAPEMQTLGYYLFRGVSGAVEAELGKWSALGLLMSLVAIPLTFLVRGLLHHYGPDGKRRMRHE